MPSVVEMVNAEASLENKRKKRKTINKTLKKLINFMFGRLYCITTIKKSESPERDTGVEPVFLPWEGNVEPLN